MTTRTKAYVCAVGALAATAGACVYAVTLTPSNDIVRACFTFAALSLLSELLAYDKAGGNESGSIAFLPLLAAVVVAPSWFAVVVLAAANAIVQITRGRVLIKAFFNVAQTGLAVSAATLVYLGLGGEPLLHRGTNIQIVPFVASLSVFFLINMAALKGAIAISEGKAFWKLLHEGAPTTVLYDLLALPFVLINAEVYVHFGPMGAFVFFAPLLGFRQLYKIRWELEKTNHELLQLMVAAIEARDPYTSGHSRRVARNAKLIAEAIGLKEKQIERVGVAALLHDVGKIHEVFAPILSKPGKLTAEENAVMQTHPIKSEELVRTVSQLRDVVSAIRHHHENWDGTGYPDGLGGENIPLTSRIIMFADTIDAMTTDRPYRAALSEAQVRAEFVKLRGRQFDPSICDALLVSEIYPRLFDQDIPLTPSVGGLPRRKVIRSPLLAS